MTKDDKIQFILNTLKSASKIYMEYPDFYNKEEEYWIDQYLTKLYFKPSLQDDKNLELIYPVTLRISDKLKNS